MSLDFSKGESLTPDGFGLAIGILTLMVAAVLIAAYAFLKKRLLIPAQQWTEWATPVLTILGLAVAGYLAYVETQLVSAFCGPVGDCNTVQTSAYAYLFGWLPIGVLGLAGYILILAIWIWKRLAKYKSSQIASLAIFGMAAFGTVFSIYLTFLEPFVIRAVCIWCLTSAIITTLPLLTSLTPAIKASSQSEAIQ